MEEYFSHVFQLLFMFVVGVVVLSTCLLGCFKSVKSVQSHETANQAIAVDLDDSCDERDPGSHDHLSRGHERALPEIPSALMRVAISVDDEEEEDDSIYDIISRNKKILLATDNQDDLPGPSSAPSLPVQPKQKMQRQHPYEKVDGDTDGDSSIYGPPSRDPLYAGIKDVSRKLNGNVQDVTQAKDILIPASEVHYLSADLGNLIMSDCPSSFISNGPLLTWNMPEFSNSPEPCNNFPNGVSDDSQGHDVRHISTFCNVTRSQNLFDSSSTQTNSNHPNVTTTSDDQRVPNYSSVTARESLNNLRKRGQLLQDNQDEMYDTINYDSIKAGSRIHRTSTILSSDHVYCTTGSDLYAEIATGQSSSRSSMYARVSDVLPQANSDFHLTSRQENLAHPSHASLSKSSDHSMVAMVYNPQFPIYSVVNKIARQRIYHDSTQDDELLPMVNSLGQTCEESSLKRNCSSYVADFITSSPETNALIQGSSESQLNEKLRSKCKTEHCYSKIIFNKQYSNQKSPKQATIHGKEKQESTSYNHFDNDSLYEFVPIESRNMRFSNQMRVGGSEKIRFPWKDKQRKLNEELRGGVCEAKKDRSINGYCHEPPFVIGHLGMNNILSNGESKSDVPSIRNTIVAGYRHLTMSGADKCLDSSKNNSVLGKSKFYVSSDILSGENDVRLSCTSSSSQVMSPPIREHIYELVKDAAYIDDEDDNDMVLESDV